MDSKNNLRQTPLHLAIELAREDIVKLLLDKRADVHIRENYGKMPLHWAAKRRDPIFTQLLLEHSANIDAIDNDRYTAHF